MNILNHPFTWSAQDRWIIIQQYAKARGLSATSNIDKEDFLEWASDPACPAHPFFQWDNDKAGHQYRLQQVGRFVRVHIVHTPGRSRRLNVQIAEATGGTEVTRPAFVSDGSKNLVPTSTKDGMDILRAHALSGNSWSLTSWHKRCQSVLRDDERKLAARLLKLLARP